MQRKGVIRLLLRTAQQPGPDGSRALHVFRRPGSALNLASHNMASWLPGNSDSLLVAAVTMILSINCGNLSHAKTNVRLVSTIPSYAGPRNPVIA